MRGVALLFVLSVVASCSGSAPVVHEAGSASLDVPRRGRLDRAALAAALAHPDAPPLVATLPAPMRDALVNGLATVHGDSARLAAGKQRVAQLKTSANPTLDELLVATRARRGALVVDLEALILLEPLVLGTGPLRDEAAPLAFDAYVEAEGLARLLASSPSASSALAPWASVDGVAFFSGAEKAARDLGDQVAATVVRRAAIDDATLHVLRQLALRDLHGGDRERTASLLEEVVRSSAKVDAGTWENLAYAYARLLDAPRATVAGERARATGTASAEALARIQRWIADARAASRLRTSTDVDSGLALAAAYQGLDLEPFAREEYQSVRARFPRDARARQGLATARLEAFRASGNPDLLRAALAELDDDSLEHVTPAFRELALGLTVFEASRLLGAQSHEEAMGMLSGLVDKLATRAQALTTDDPARAAAVGYLAGVLRDVLQGQAPLWPRLARCLSEARALRQRFPQSLDVAKIALAAASLADSRDEPLADVAAKVRGPAASDASYMVDRATTAVALAARSLDGTAVARARSTVAEARAVAGVPRGKLDALEGDLDTLEALGGEPAAWAQAEQAYRRALDDVGTTERARARSNMGLIASRQSRAEEARALWKTAAEESNAGERARCNEAIALAGDPATRSQARAQLETWVNDPASPCISLTLATLAAIGHATGEPRTRVRDLAQAALDRVAQEGVFAGPPYAQMPQVELQMSATLRPANDSTGRDGEWPISLDLAIRTGLWFNPLPPLDAAALRKLAGPRR